MVDLMSVAVGLLCGGCVGFISGRLTSFKEIEQHRREFFNLACQLDTASKELDRLKQRDARGRFTGGKR